ncbi:MAG: sigma-70 family RNA polymerase sigma factor [Cytophagaceae bacterium]|nr:sigma-70 family RNA polymerase sigma factor [Cytophagaceae bacterium]
MAEKEETIRNTFQKEKKKLFQFIRKRVPAKEDAEDILQDVFYQLIKNFTPLEPMEQISSWLFKVARNKITDKYRKQKPESYEKYVSEDSEGENYFLQRFFDPKNNPEDEYFRSVIWDALIEALEELPEEQKEVFVLHEIEEKDFKEISEIIGVSVNTLLSRKRYAVLYLRKRLNEFYKELLNY